VPHAAVLPFLALHLFHLVDEAKVFALQIFAGVGALLEKRFDLFCVVPAEAVRKRCCWMSRGVSGHNGLSSVLAIACRWRFHRGSPRQNAPETWTA